MVRLTIPLLVVFNLALYGQQIEIAVQKGHSADITFITFNRSGLLLASSGKDNLVKLWHVPTGKEMASFLSEYNQDVKSVSFSADDDYLYVLYRDGSIHTWDIAASLLRSTVKPAESLSFATPWQFRSSDSTYLVFVKDFYLRKKHRQTGKHVYSKVPADISRNFTSVAVSEKFNRVVAASEDGKLYVYNYKTGRSEAILDEHYSSVNSVCFSPDETMFASASSDRSIILWDVGSLKVIKRQFGRSFRYESLAFDKTGTLLAAGDELGKGKVIDLKSSRINVSSYSWHSEKVTAIRFSHDNKKIFTAGADNRINVFDFENEKVVEQNKYINYISAGDFILKAFRGYREPYAWVNTLSVSPGGKYLAAGGGWRESQIRRQPQPLWFKDLPANNIRKLRSHQGSITSVAFVNSVSFVTASGNDLLEWYVNTTDNSLYFRQLATEGRDIRSVEILSQDTIIIHKDNTLEIFGLKEGKTIRQIQESKTIGAVGAHPSSGMIAYSLGTDLCIQRLNVGSEPIRIIRAHTDRITGIAFSPTRALLATCGWDATVKLWDTNTGTLLATIISMGKDDHMIIAPDGYYFGTRNSLKGIGYKYGKQFISPEQFDLRYNRPDIVLSRLGFVPEKVIRAYNRAYQKRLQKMNFTEEMLSEEVHLPQIKVTSEKLPLYTPQTEIDFQLNAFDSKYNLDRINVFVNNIPVYGLRGIDVRERQVKEVTEAVRLKLVSGRNKVQVSCLNEKGVESLLETFEIECQEEAKKPNLYLAVISVSEYQNPKMNLKYAVKDGGDLIRLLTRKNEYYDRIFVDTLLNRNATRERIVDLKKKLNQVEIDDQVIVFVSGHGLLDDRLDFYFATHDIDFENPSARGVKYDDLENLLDGIPARKKLLLIDACHSGEVDKSRLQRSTDQTAVLAKNQKGTVKTYTYPSDASEEHYQVGIKTSFELMQELFANVSKGSGAVVIAAAAGNSYALESDEWRNGVFTYAILSGLRDRTADLNRNGHITVTELKDFTSQEVQRLTKGEQKPTSRSENLEFDFKVF